MAKRNIWTDKTSRYGTYEGERGNPNQWRNGFAFVWNNATTIKVLNGIPPRTILGVSETATMDEIKTAFRRLVKMHHPDKGGDRILFEQVIVAYSLLTTNGDVSRMVQQDYAPLHRTTHPSSSSIPDIIPQLLTEIEESEVDRYLKDDNFCAQEKKDGRHLTLELKQNHLEKRFIIRNKKRHRLRL